MAQGHFATVYSAAQFYTDPNFDYDVYVFHRPNRARTNFATVQRQLRVNGRTLIADYDDLIFGDAETALGSAAVKNGTLVPQRAEVAFANNLAALREFDTVTVSTEPLRARVKMSHPGATVSVTPNIIPPSVLTIHEDLHTHLSPRPRTAIGYFAGTKSHNQDFPIVADALRRVLIENPHFTLMVVGPVEVPSTLVGLPNVTTGPIVNFLRLPGLMTMCNTVIAPLERSEFNACKSRVKFLEAALSGTRLLASPIPDMQAVGESHIDLVDTLDDWYEALSSPPSSTDFEDRARANFRFLKDSSRVDGLKALWSEES